MAQGLLGWLSPRDLCFSPDCAPERHVSGYQAPLAWEPPFALQTCPNFPSSNCSLFCSFFARSLIFFFRSLIFYIFNLVYLFLAVCWVPVTVQAFL